MGEVGSIQVPVFSSYKALFLYHLGSVGQPVMDVSIGNLQSNLARCGIHWREEEPVGFLL